MEVHDVPGAFLKSEIKEDSQPLYGFKRMYPKLAHKISPQGSLYFKLKRWIYGTTEASKQFYDTMSSYLRDLGFAQSKCDPCLFFREEEYGAYIIICVYVDDLLAAADRIEDMAWISSDLRKTWETVYHVGDEFNYVGLHIVRDREKRAIRIDMSGNIKKIIQQFGEGVKESKVPSTEAILEQTGTPLDSAQRTQFMSLVMSVLYPARMCHMSALFATTILATRMQNPTDNDMEHARRLIGYLKTQVNGGFVLTGDLDSSMRTFVDASHAIHADGKGHGCMVVCMGNSPIAWR